MTTIRAAAAQFEIGGDPAENLDTVLRMIEAAAAERPDVLVLPEFCNHRSIYDSGEHAWQVAIDLDGPWVTAVGEAAARHRCWIHLNCTVRREPGRITNTNLLLSAEGRLAAANDKTVLMGAEGEFLSPADTPAELVEAPFGWIGTYACMDGVIAEVPRGLVVRGAQLLLNSLNSFALDEASLHIPVRAAENKVWVVAACKVGPLLPPDRLEAFAQAMAVPAEFLRGAGESQIVAPDGSVVAKAPRDGEAVIAADIDLSRADAKVRADGVDVIAARRPEIYAPLAAPNPTLDAHPRAEELAVAVLGDGAPVVDSVAAAVADGAELVVAPYLAAEGQLDELAAVAGDAVVVSSLRRNGAHVGVAITCSGVIGEQLQIHRSDQEVLGDRVTPVDLPWGRLGIVVGIDSIFPEVARLAALAECDVLAVPFAQVEPWETSLGLVERAAENRVCLVASNRSGEGRIITLPPDFTLWAPSRHRPFDGTINQPEVTPVPAGASWTAGVVHPARAVNRQISRGTNLVDGRPWRVAGPLVV